MPTQAGDVGDVAVRGLWADSSGPWLGEEEMAWSRDVATLLKSSNPIVTVTAIIVLIAAFN